MSDHPDLVSGKQEWRLHLPPVLGQTVNIGIIGAGRMAQALARLFLANGHQIMLSNSRGAASLAELTSELGSGAHAGTTAEAAAFGPVVFLATRWEKTPAAVAELGPWPGTIVVDTTNNRFSPGPNDLYDLGGRTSSEVVADLVPGARLVKAFNHQPIASLATLLEPEQPAENALFVSGDDPEACHVVAELIREAGGTPFELGSLREGGALHTSGSGSLVGFGRMLTPGEARTILAHSSNQNAV